MGLERELQQLDRRSRSAAARMRFNSALATLLKWLPAWLGLGCAALAAQKFALLPPSWLPMVVGLVLVAGLGVLAVVLRTVLRHLPPQQGSLALDRHHHLADSVTNALEFSRIPPARRSALMELAIEEAARIAPSVRPSHAVRLRVPLNGLYSVGVLVLALLITRLDLKAPPQVHPPEPAALGFQVEPDDLQMMREMGRQWQQTSNSAQAQQTVQRFNRLVEELAQRKLDRHQVLDRLEELERQLGVVGEEQKAALDEALQGVARALQSSQQARPTASALAARSLPDAEQALRELAEKLRHKGGVDRKQLEDLRRALEAASHETTQRLERLTAERRQVEQARKRLLHKKKAGDSSPATQSQLDQHERHLERLNRERRRAEQGQQQLSQLDRELAEAARRLFEDMGGGAEQLQTSADELSKMAKEQLSDKEKQELKKQLEALRQMLREQGKAGQQRQQQLREFARRARGKAQAGSKGGAGQPSAVQLGQRGVPVGVAAGAGKTMAAEPGSPGAPGQGPSGEPRAGTGTDPNLTGDPSSLKGRTQDVAAAGIDSGEGPSASSLVYGAAERGFVGGGYKRVYTEYKTVAEETLQKDQIPAGYEAYVRRYFQLIRPRD